MIEQDRCTGCDACTVACQEEHGLPAGVFRTWVKRVERGDPSDPSRFFAVLRCNHCQDAPCLPICPTRALFARPDGIVDFDSGACIGCRACQQACPYDAIYIDPRDGTAAKCDFCVARVDRGEQPACVAACPERVILSGDLEDATGEVARRVLERPVQIRKPEARAGPYVFYIGADGPALVPGLAERDVSWSEPAGAGQSAGGATPLFRIDPLAAASGPENSGSGSGDSRRGLLGSREVFNVRQPPAWGWRVSLALWARSIGAGALLVAALLSLLGPSGGRLLNLAAPAIGLGAGLVTLGLLLSSLTRPGRWHLLLSRPNGGSWLVRGTWLLAGQVALAGVWLAGGIFGLIGLIDAIRWPAALAAVGSLFAAAGLSGQAVGRDYWRSQPVLVRSVVAALVAGASTLLAATVLTGQGASVGALVGLMMPGLLALGALLVVEQCAPGRSIDQAFAADLLLDGALAPYLWGGAMFVGVVVPLVLLVVSAGGASSPFYFLAALSALTGLLVYEDVWLQAGQAPPLS